MSGDDEDFILEEFEWALKDPTEEKLRALGDVVSTITKKLVDAIGDLDKRLYDVETKLDGIDSKVNQIASRGVAPPSAASAASAAPDMASAPIAKAPTARPPPTGGGGGLMGELKTLLEARRRKADSTGE